MLFAYIDPGSAAILVQVVVGGLLAAGVMFRNGFLSLFGVRRRSSADSGSSDADEHSEQ